MMCHTASQTLFAALMYMQQNSNFTKRHKMSAFKVKSQGHMSTKSNQF